jgi:CxxC motif-containing protein
MSFQSSCVTCPDGYFCLEGAIQYALSKCPKGYKCPAGTKYAAQYPCSPGQY